MILIEHHGRHRPYIHIPAGQQLPNLKSQEVTALALSCLQKNKGEET